jgi:hypothetical protein
MRTRLTAAMVAVVTAAGLLAGSGGASAAGASTLVPPSQDPFYAVPANVASYQPGQIIQSRQVTPKIVVVDLPAVQAWQVLYRTNDGVGAPTATVATVIVPDAPWTGPGTRPLVSYQSAEDSDGIDCAPSYAWRDGIFAGLGASLSDPLAVAPALLAGWGIVVPDYEGPQGMFGVGRMAGHAVLDGIRAALHFTPDGLAAHTQVATFGYSGGGLATGWAGELQGSYAPELNYVATVGGGTPGKILDVAQWLTGHGNYAAGLAIGAIIGIIKQYPDLMKLLNAKGQALYSQYQNSCALQLVAGFPFANINDYTNSPNILADPEVVADATYQSMGSQAPKAPVANYHGQLDEVVPFAQDKETVKQWCAAGATVHAEWPFLAEHGLGGVPWYLDGITYLGSRFAGIPPINDCWWIQAS